MEDNGSNCPNCDGMTVTTLNGRTVIEVPETYGLTSGVSIHSQIAEATAVLEGAMVMRTLNGRTNQFRLADTTAEEVLPGGHLQGMPSLAVDLVGAAGNLPSGFQLLTTTTVKGRTTLVKDLCPTGEARLLQHNDYYDEDGNLIKTEEFYLTECEPHLDAAARLAKLRGQKLL